MKDLARVDKELGANMSFSLNFALKLFSIWFVTFIFVFATLFVSTNNFSQQEKMLLKRAPQKVIVYMIRETIIPNKVKDSEKQYIHDLKYALARKSWIPFLLSFFLSFLTPYFWVRMIKNRIKKSKKDNSIEEYNKSVRNKEGLSIGGYDEDEHILIDTDTNPRDMQKEKEYRKNSIIIKKEDETSHFMFIGQSGTGKSVLSSQVFEQLKRRGSKMIVHDNKMDYTAKFYNPTRDLIFNPLDQRGLGWSIMNDIDNLVDIESIAHSLFPKEVSNSDPFWIDSARTLFIEILKYAKVNHITKNSELFEMLSSNRRYIMDEIDTNLVRNLLSSEKQGSSILSVLNQYAKSIEYLKDGDFSVKKWIKSSINNTIFITNNKNIQEMIAPLLTLFIDLTSKQLLSLEDDFQRRVYFVLEEMGMLNKLSSIVDLITNGRSKGASVLISIQDLSRLEELYGKEFNTLFANCNTKIFFRIGDKFTVQYIKDYAGTFDAKKVDESVPLKSGEDNSSRNLRFHVAKEDILQIGKLTTLQDRVFLVKPKSFDKYLELKTYIKPYEKYNETFVG